MSCRDALLADSDTSGRIQPTPSEEQHGWYDTLSSPHHPFGDYGPAGATQRVTLDQQLLLRYRAVGPAEVQRWIHTYGDRGPAPLVRRNWPGSNDPDLRCRGLDEVC